MEAEEVEREEEEQVTAEAAAKDDVVRVGENGELQAVIDGNRVVGVRKSVAEAVMEMRRKAPPLRGNGIFRHPPDWTEEEINFIVDSLKKHIPLYVIAGSLHCERHTLSELIQKMPELRRIREDVYEDLWDETIYQTDRLMKSGTPSIVISMWDRLGPRHGFGPAAEGGGQEGGSKIVMGVIPEEDVKKANEDVKSLGGLAAKTAGGVMPDPISMALIEETVKDEVAEAVEKAKPEAIDAESVDVGSAPYEQQSMGMDGFGMMGGGVVTEDPWAAGADSPFTM